MRKKIIGLLVLAVVIYACSKSESITPDPTDNFDRKEMLTHIADNLIIPAFEDFNTKSTALKTAATDFSNSPTAQSLTALRNAWYTAYKTWQHIEMFNIGKAEELQFVNFINIYPVTVADVDANITSGTYDLNHSNNHDAQGFPALDYLLYGVGSDDTAILEKYTTNANAANYKKYLTDIATKINGITKQVLDDWKGSYYDKFINNSGNTATSSLNKLVNDYIYYYEKGLRANKIGIPAGNFSATSLPEKVEAFYRKDISKELALEALTAVQNFFTGKHYSSNNAKLGLNVYLQSLNKASLATNITNSLATARTQLNTLDANFYQQIKTDNTAMTKTYDALQKVVVLLKVEMLQAFKINVDYVDADGD